MIENRRRDYHTPSLTAFRRKKALHGAHVATEKLIPTAVWPHTKHGPRFREFIAILNKYYYNIHSLVIAYFFNIKSKINISKMDK